MHIEKLDLNLKNDLLKKILIPKDGGVLNSCTLYTTDLFPKDLFLIWFKPKTVVILAVHVLKFNLYLRKGSFLAGVC